MEQNEDVLLQYAMELAERLVVAFERIADALDRAADDAPSP